MRAPTDPTGYRGPLRWLEVMLGGKNRPGSGLWAEAEHLTTIVHDAAFATRKPLNDSHGQIAHYARSFELFDKDDPEHKSELMERLDTIPHLADFHIDIDHDGDLDTSRAEAIRLVEFYLNLGVPEPALGIRFSGKKGFDVMVPWQCMGVQAQGVMALNWTTYKIVAQEVAESLGLQGIDMGLYRKNGTIRLENTAHPSGLHKVRITPDELAMPMADILKIAEKPRRSPYEAAAVEAALETVVGLRRMYLPAQARADAELLQVKALRQLPLDLEVQHQLQGEIVTCAKTILNSVPDRGQRNERLFHLAMMLKYTGKDEAETRHLAKGWLGRQYQDVGGESTIRSVYSGPYAGGCRWMREMGFAYESDCRACPVGQRRYERDARVVEAEPVVAAEPHLPTIEEQRKALARDFEHMDPWSVTVVRVPPGIGKTYQALRRTVKMIEDGARVLWFVKDTRKADGLAADLISELQEKHDYSGKIQVLYGRDEDNCEDWSNAERIAKKGYSVGKTLCKGCPARSYCGYYAQYDQAYEPGVYIAPHAMLPILFEDERRGFSREFVTWKDDGEVDILGAPLSMIVIDEDALDVMVEEYFVGKYHLENELRKRTRRVKYFDRLSGQIGFKDVQLDKNWLQVVEWLGSAVKVPGPVMPSLSRVAAADGASIVAILNAIDPAYIIDPDYKTSRGHKPFTTKLYQALMREAPRLRDGNYTIWTVPSGGLKILSMANVQFPPGIPVVVLDAYANRDLYERFYRAAGVNRPLLFLDYPVREQANVTYVLGANILKVDLMRAESNYYSRTKIERTMTALERITQDGVETYIVAKRDFFQSKAWQEWEPRLKNCVADGDAGQLYFWRGRGINAAAGKRIAILQVPNFHPDAVLAEASVLFADEPRLDDARVRVEEPIVWANDAEAKPWVIDRTVYADDRLNLVNERYRMDELVQMALRSRSLTTGAEIVIFADLPDPRLPASKVVTVAELAEDTFSARAEVYEVLREYDSLSIETLIDLGIVNGQAQQDSKMRSILKRTCPVAFLDARKNPVEREVAMKEIAGA